MTPVNCANYTHVRPGEHTVRNPYFLLRTVIITHIELVGIVFQQSHGAELYEVMVNTNILTAHIPWPTRSGHINAAR